MNITTQDYAVQANGVPSDATAEEVAEYVGRSGGTMRAVCNGLPHCTGAAGGGACGQRHATLAARQGAGGGSLC